MSDNFADIDLSVAINSRPESLSCSPHNERLDRNSGEGFRDGRHVNV